MAETHTVVFPYEEGKPQISIEDPEPLHSANLFKSISDAIWDRRRENWDWAEWSIESVLDPQEALSRANVVAEAIDQRLLLAGAGKDLRLHGGRSERAKISSNTLMVPEAVSLETFYWDNRWEGRQIKVDGDMKYAKFTDGHFDYARELSARFHFATRRGALVVSYLMQRYQYQQAEPTTLNAHVWYSPFAETGYEGNSLQRVEMTEEQELTMLKVFADIGGIVIV